MGSNIGYHVSDSRNIGFNQLEKLEDEGYRKIWRNKGTGEKFEQYTVFDTSNKLLQGEYDIYEKRRVQNINLVKVFYVQNVNKELVGSCCKQLRVFTEHIPVLTSELASMDLASALLFLKKAFQGYEVLYKQVGFFEILQNFMGINDQHQPKIWLNNNWSINKPTSKMYGASNTIFLAGIMVQQIFSIIEKLVNHVEIENFLNEKKKIQQWTFEAAHHFIHSFIHDYKIILPQKILFTQKNSQNCIYQGQKPKISKMNLSILIPDQNTQQHFITSPRKLFPSNIPPQASPHYKYETYNVLNFRPKNQVMSPKNNTFVFDPKIKRSQMIKDQKPLDVSTKIVTKRRHSQYNFMDFSCHIQKLQQHKNKQSKQRSSNQKSFIKNSKTNSFIQNKVNNQKQSRNSIINVRRADMSENKIKTQSTIIKTHLRIVKPTINLNTSQAHSSKADKSKTSQHDVTHNTIKTSTVDSNQGFHSPAIKSRNPFVNNSNSNKNWLVLSQQLQVPTQTFDESSQKSPGPSSPYPLSNQPKHSDVIAQDIQQVSDFFIGPQQPKRLSKHRMSQSITINQFATQPKRNDKPLSMLDMFVSKKTVQKVQIIGQQPNISNPNNLTLSIIQPRIQQSIEQQV